MEIGSAGRCRFMCLWPTWRRPLEAIRTAEDSARANLPDGWEVSWDSSHQCLYYYNRDTLETSWERPAVDAACRGSRKAFGSRASKAAARSEMKSGSLEKKESFIGAASARPRHSKKEKTSRHAGGSGIVHAGYACGESCALCRTGMHMPAEDFRKVASMSSLEAEGGREGGSGDCPERVEERQPALKTNSIEPHRSSSGMVGDDARCSSEVEIQIAGVESVVSAELAVPVASFVFRGSLPQVRRHPHEREVEVVEPHILPICVSDVDVRISQSATFQGEPCMRLVAAGTGVAQNISLPLEALTEQPCEAMSVLAEGHDSQLACVVGGDTTPKGAEEVFVHLVPVTFQLCAEAEVLPDQGSQCEGAGASIADRGSQERTPTRGMMDFDALISLGGEAGAFHGFDCEALSKPAVKIEELADGLVLSPTAPSSLQADDGYSDSEASPFYSCGNTQGHFENVRAVDSIGFEWQKKVELSKPEASSNDEEQSLHAEPDEEPAGRYSPRIPSPRSLATHATQATPGVVTFSPATRSFVDVLTRQPFDASSSPRVEPQTPRLPDFGSSGTCPCLAPSQCERARPPGRAGVANDDIEASREGSANSKSAAEPVASAKGIGKGGGKPVPLLLKGKGNSKGGRDTKVEPRKKEVTPNVPLKKLYWQPISLETNVKKPDGSDEPYTIWEKIDQSHTPFDTREVEELFAEETVALASPRWTRGASREPAGSSRINGVRCVRILEEKRRRQLWFALALMPPAPAILEAVERLDDGVLQPDKVELLQANLPSLEEESMLRNSPPLAADEIWDASEEFLFGLIRIPSYSLRINVWAYLNNSRMYHARFEEARRAILRACELLQGSKQVESLLAFALYVGNYLNGGTQRGRADGFDLGTLSKLVELKSSGMQMAGVPTKDNMTLLDFIVLQVERANPGSLRGMFLPSMELESVKEARRHRVSDIEDEIRNLRASAQDYLQKLEDHGLLGGDLADRATKLAECRDKFAGITRGFQHVRERYARLCAWFQISMDKPRQTDEFFSIWEQFLQNVKKALASVEKQLRIKPPLGDISPRRRPDPLKSDIQTSLTRTLNKVEAMDGRKIQRAQSCAALLSQRQASSCLGTVRCQRSQTPRHDSDHAWCHSGCSKVLSAGTAAALAAAAEAVMAETWDFGGTVSLSPPFFTSDMKSNSSSNNLS